MGETAVNGSASTIDPEACCSLCGGTLGPVLLLVTKPDRFERQAKTPEVGYRREWVECPDCGAATNVLRPADRQRLAPLAKAYYQIDYGSRSLAERYAEVMAMAPTHSDNAGRVRRVRRFAQRFWGANVLNPRALDVGAGLGVFLARLAQETLEAKEHWRLAAVESDPLAVSHLRSLRLFDVVAQTFPCVLPEESYDLVTLNKVLEHFEEPLTLLQELRQYLNARYGLLYVEVPDKRTINSRPPEDNILGALHRHLYSPTSLARLFERAGLEVLTVERIVEPSGKISVFGFACMFEATIPVAAER
ncbi:MAG: class I SAM-dependent methyltransferase [Alphaproteobacteria bacterium]|nr:class I SAM-dependent methyltransferase [Alphaproteobacteria bacterium]